MNRGDDRERTDDGRRGELRRLWIPGEAGRLEAALRVACPACAAAVVAHPHPLHGGTLHNPVVFHADRELHRAGLTTLRFNFRGVGESAGEYDEGRGEVEDVASATSWIRGVARGLPLLLVGYSFGAWCAIRHAADNPAVRGVIAVGLPLRRFSLDGLERLRRPLAVVQGGADEFGSPDEVRRRIEALSPAGTLRVVEGAPHLFPGRAHEVGAAVAELAAPMLAAPADPPR
jgi:alpha/beta superfamily hydrolase